MPYVIKKFIVKGFLYNVQCTFCSVALYLTQRYRKLCKCESLHFEVCYTKGFRKTVRLFDAEALAYKILKSIRSF